MSERSIRLLIADSEDSIRESIENYIRKHSSGIDEVLGAGNGRQALDFIFGYRPRVMLLDIQIPPKGGLYVLKEATAAGVCPRTIVISRRDNLEYARKAIRCGAAGYLLKPCRTSEILRKVELAAQKDAGNPGGRHTAGGGGQHADSGNHLVDAAMAYMREHYPDDITLPLVAEHIGITASYLSTLFTRTLGRSFVECLNTIRIDSACGYFHDATLKAYEVAYLVGFHDEKYFSSVFKKLRGVSPSEFRRGIKGAKEEAAP